MAVKEYMVKKDGQVLRTYKSLPSAKQLAEKEIANVYCDGICVYKVVPEEADMKVEKKEMSEPQGQPEADVNDYSEKYILAALMNVRKEPSLDAAIVATLPAGTEVSVEKVEDNWLHLTDGTYIFYNSGKFAAKNTAV